MTKKMKMKIRNYGVKNCLNYLILKKSLINFDGIALFIIKIQLPFI